MPRQKKELIEEIKETSDACKVETLSEVTSWLSTGATPLDLAISNRYPGGLPLGRIVHVYGASGTCKTVLALSIVGYAQRNNIEAYYGDVEYAVDSNFTKKLGVDFDLLKENIGYPETVEDFFDNWLMKVLKPDGKKLNTNPKIIIIDSLTALPTKFELDNKMDEQGYQSTRAKQIGLGFRKYCKLLNDTNSTLFFIDQTRDAMGSFFGGETTSGGRSREFYPSVRIYLKHDGKIVDTKKIPIGIWVKFKIEKNRVAPPFREGRFRLIFDYGIDDINSNLYFLAVEQVGEKQAKNKTAKIKIWDEEKTRKAWVKHIEENDLELKLRKEVYRVWQDIYKREERKERVW